MRIQKSTFEEILKTVPCVPPETGGIIGGTDKIVTHFVLDNGSNMSNGYDTYAPDTLLLNNTIQKWTQEGIEFYGIFHSHFPQGTELSNGDKRYITHIMNGMPQHVEQLYFPIVLPMENIIVYRADKVEKNVYFTSDDIEFY